MKHGVYTPLLIPLNKDKSIDFVGLKNVISWYIECGITGIVLFSQSGEYKNFFMDEKKEILSKVNEYSQSNLDIIADITSLSTEVSFASALECQKYNINHFISKGPYFLSANQKETFSYFVHLSNEFNANLTLNIDNAFLGFDLNLKTLNKITNLKSVNNVIYSDFNVDIVAHYSKNLEIDTSQIFIENDLLAHKFLEKGAGGMLSPLAALFPRHITAIFNLCSKQEYNKAEEIINSLKELHNVLFLDEYSVVAKWILSQSIQVNPWVKPPLETLSRENQKIVLKNLHNFQSLEII